jgi:anthranilate phosphoribosyltransferase
MTNPAMVRRQLIGVFDGNLTETVAKVLHELGSERVYVVHGLDGSDEVSVTSDTKVSSLNDGKIETFMFSPSSVGIDTAPAEAIAGGTAEENAQTIIDVLSGEKGPRRDAVLLNAAFVASVADKVARLDEGVAMASEAIDSGEASAVLDRLRQVSAGMAAAE